MKPDKRFISLKTDNNENYTTVNEIQNYLYNSDFNWILDCEVDYVILEIKDNILYWLDGIFYHGDWKFGVFENGKFVSGNWYGGIFKNGIMLKYSNFKNGIIYKNTFNNIQANLEKYKIIEDND